MSWKGLSRAVALAAIGAVLGAGQASAVPLRVVIGTSISSASSGVANAADPASASTAPRARRASGSGT